MINKKVYNIAIAASVKAGDEIMTVYSGDIVVETKDDQSPLTEADKRSHNTICQYLEQTGLPILSEEGRDIPVEERSQWPLFWLVDPLDGTKEFVKRNGEFTVNIALIKDGKPVFGVIWVPVKEWLYIGSGVDGAFKYCGRPDNERTYEQLLQQAEKLPVNHNLPFTVVASRSHMSEETEAYIDSLKEKHGDIAITSIGSSLKICLVAEGLANEYPRFAPTMEWDTAAGHAIALAAGKHITDRKTSEEMRYNKENLLNNWFLVK